MLRAVSDRGLDQLLARVSRSFYLSLAILPASVRTQLSVTYLAARAADTIADTEAVRRERRRELLGELVSSVAAAAQGESAPARTLAQAVRRELLGASATIAPSERVLLERLDEVLALLARQDAADLARARRVLEALAHGMDRDLARFDGMHLHALGSLDELDRHCYDAAGCVGEYWTAMTAAHVDGVRHLDAPAHLERGVRLGKALQMVNVIRDAPADLADGRCYWPAPLLAEHGLAPDELLDAARRRRARPVFAALCDLALDHLDAAWPYVRAIPASEPRLRLACIWPLWIGLATLEKLADLDDPLDPHAVRKIARRDVYRLMAESAAGVAIEPLLERLHRRRRRLAAT